MSWVCNHGSQALKHMTASEYDEEASTLEAIMTAVIFASTPQYVPLPPQPSPAQHHPHP
jgi:hypothetical protein